MTLKKKKSLLRRPHVVVVCRDFPHPGGRVSWAKLLLTQAKDQFRFTILTRQPATGATEARRVHVMHQGLFHFHLRSYHELKKIHAKDPIDVVVGTGLSALSAMVFARLHRVKGVFNTSGLRWFHYKQLPVQFKRVGVSRETKKRRVFAGLYSILADFLSLTLARKTVVPSQNISEDIARLYPWLRRKLVLFPEGIAKLPVSDRSHVQKNIRKQLGIATAQQVVVFYRRMQNSWMRHTLPLLRKRFPKMAVIHISKDITLYYRGKRRILDISVYDAFVAADCGICPSPREAHSSSTLEAFACGTPCFVTRTGWFELEFQDTPSFFLAEISRGALLEKIEDFFARQGWYKKQFVLLRKRVLEKYHPHTCIQSFEQLLKRL